MRSGPVGLPPRRKKTPFNRGELNPRQARGGPENTPPPHKAPKRRVGE